MADNPTSTVQSMPAPLGTGTVVDRPAAGISVNEALARVQAQGGVASMAAATPAPGIGHNQPPSSMLPNQPAPGQPAGVAPMGDPGIAFPDPMDYRGTQPRGRQPPQPAVPSPTGGPPPGTAPEEIERGWLRTQDYHRKTMEVANLRKELEAQLAQANQAFNAFVQVREKLLAELPPGIEEEAREFAKVDWGKLARDNPPFYAQLDAAYKTHLHKIDVVNRAQAIKNAGEQARIQDELMRGHAVLVQAYPGIWDDDTKRVHLQGAIMAHLREMGFSEEQVRQGTNNPLLVILADQSRRYAEMRKQKLKPQPPQPAVPQIQGIRPTGTRSVRDRMSSMNSIEANAELAQRRMQAGKGKVEDGVAVMRMLRAQRRATNGGGG